MHSLQNHWRNKIFVGSELNTLEKRATIRRFIHRNNGSLIVKNFVPGEFFSRINIICTATEPLEQVEHLP